MKYLLLSLLILLASCSREQPAQSVEAAAAKPQQPLEVQVIPAEERRFERSILVTGSLLPDDSVTVVSEVPGKIASIRVDFGQTVRKGDVVAEIDKTEYQIQIDRSRAALAQALARLGLDPKDGDTTPTNTPAMRQAWNQMEDAKFKFESGQKLIKSGDISQDRYNELEKAFRAREAAYEATKDEMRTQWANVEALRVDVRLVEKKLRDTVIYAPFDGSVSERKASPGQYVKDNVPILTIVKTNPMRLRVEIPESAVASVRVGTPLEFTTDSVPGSKFSAAVRELNPSLNDQSRTLIAEARFTSNDNRLRPGMFVQVRVILARDVQSVVVPRKAVYTVAGLTKVFVVRDGKLVECRIAPGQILDQWMEVPSDVIKKGEPIVVSDVPTLTDGQPVVAKRG